MLDQYVDFRNYASPCHKSCPSSVAHARPSCNGSVEDSRQEVNYIPMLHKPHARMSALSRFFELVK